MSTKINLKSFLSTVTPILSSRNMEEVRLKDIWDSLEEASAYGVAVPVTIGNGPQFIQHFAPTLSAIQIFIRNQSTTFMRGDKNKTGDGSTSSGTPSNSSNGSTEKAWEGPSSTKSMRDYRNPKPFDARLGSPYLQFNECHTPYHRQTFWNQIDEQAKLHPGLMSFKCVDLSPASWVAIAWYPIYSIPAGQHYMDLATCFLTYHTLSYSMQGSDLNTRGCRDGAREGESSERRAQPTQMEGKDLSLPPFGLLSHKMYGDLWLSDTSAEDKEMLVKMSNNVDAWMKELGVSHLDYNFFSQNRRM